MSFFTPVFLIFLAVGLIAFYTVSSKWQWCVLLLLSLLFYCYGGIAPIVFLLITCLSVWGAAYLIDRDRARVKEMLAAARDRDKARVSEATTAQSADNAAHAKESPAAAPFDPSAIKKAAKCRYKRILIITLILNIGILAFLKYFVGVANFFGLKAFTEGSFLPGSIILPLGISFYTFSAVGYITDVYGGYAHAEKNPLKLLLFLSFFPHIVQGPIGRTKTLLPQLFTGHSFDLRNLENGALLFVWGAFKKLVIADRAWTIVGPLLTDPYSSDRGEVFIFYVLLYSAWQYADFSGGIDMVTGVAQMFGISLDENFKRPYFATSISDFWRRWHVSLGNFMRDYVFYPLSMSRPMTALGRKLSNKSQTLRLIPIAISSVITFVLVGVWHGPYMHYVVWGLYNGIIISIEKILEPGATSYKKRHGINEDDRLYRVFCIIRTFILVNIGWFFDGPNLKEGLYMLKRIVTDFTPGRETVTIIHSLGLEKLDYMWLLLGIVTVFVISLLKENGVKIRESLWKMKLPLRWLIIYSLIFMTVIMAVSEGGLSGFAYAQF